MWRWIEFTALFWCCLLTCEAAHSKGCLPPKDQIKLDSKREQIERFLMLAKIGERQASRLVHSPAQPTWNEAPTFGAPLDPGQILTVHDCVWSELLNELVKWKPQNLKEVLGCYLRSLAINALRRFWSSLPIADNFNPSPPDFTCRTTASAPIGPSWTRK
jgi:hypothetical protein